MPHEASFGSKLGLLVQSAQSDDQTAVNRYLQEYRSALAEFAVLRGVPPEVAEDVVQEAFARLLRSLQALDALRGKFRCLLLGVTRGAIQEIRRRRKLPPLPQDDAEDDPDFDRAWFRTLSRRAFERLQEESGSAPSPFLRILQLRTSGEDIGEIARRMRLPLPQAKILLQMARQRLAKFEDALMAEYLTEEEFEREATYLRSLDPE